MKPYKSLFFFSTMMLLSCNNPSEQKQETMYKTTRTIERLDPAINAIISDSAKIEIIAEGFEWSEGPLWLEKQQMLIFSDVPMNTIYKWTEEKGKEVYLKPSGYTGSEPSVCKEPGSNGLTFDNNGNLVLCQHGDRRMARMDAPLDKPTAKFSTLADKYQGKRFSSPNDAVYNKAGELFFTDPPYGLQTQDDTDSKKEIKHNGVYKVMKDGTVKLLIDSITRPNGLAFLPGEKKLIVACSDPAFPNWYIYDLNVDTFEIDNGRIFYSASEEAKTMGGLPDGLKIDKNGNIFATGPGGVYIFNSDGKKLGMIKLENSASNCALSPDEKTLYVTNDMYLLRIKLRD
ncbi:SMP-30/gluconolactonase/LRE family protein [Lacibacter luteus]|uniref:SMP-30/gluconolactonase/LRE family protein n=2 Tax=Lacibacter luteus TaxID=2508719 RepID=A0A4Q1CL86_9BACT|nr:SMP-30/gluconolactonase/LRE family protein [Lacibacter luteus]